MRLTRRSRIRPRPPAPCSQLRSELGFPFWAVTRVTGATYAILATGDAGFPAGTGEHLEWTQTLCRVAIDGDAPRIAPDVRAVPAYRSAPLAQQWGVAAYLTAPLSMDGRSLFGTVCALDNEPRPAHITPRLALVDLQARLLSTVLAGDLLADAARRRAERAEADAMLDPLTGLANRRGWELLLDREEQRCRRYGGVASVLVVDLDGLKAVNDRQGHAAGDVLLQRAAQVLRAAFRRADVVARLGGDEFAVLAVETDAAAVVQERERLQVLLEGASVPASIGVAARTPRSGLFEAWTSADADMYNVKRAKAP